MIGEIGLGVLASCLGVSLYISNTILKPRLRTYAEVLANEKAYYDDAFKWFEKTPFQEEAIRMSDGTVLVGRWYEVEAAKGVCVIAHGIRVNQIASIKYAALFHQMGYHVLTYDQRNHGMSEGAITTYGEVESRDLKEIISWLLAHKSIEGLSLITHGESMGGATVLMHAAMDERIDAVIADCSFESFERALIERMWREKHIPKWPFLGVTSLIYWLKTGIWLKDISPRKAIESIKKPVLLIHGAADHYVSISHGKRLYSAAKGNDRCKYLWVPDAGHAKSLRQAPESYREYVAKWLGNEIG
jgi:hypothetical protein